MDWKDIDTLARTLYGEARGEYKRPEGGLAALIAVANVVLNRVQRGGWFGKTISDVCRKPFQFSCWNRGDPNFPLIAHVKEGDDDVFALCLHVAEKVAGEHWPDLTQGATYYHASTMSDFPSWARGHRPVLRIGRHVFYRL